MKRPAVNVVMWHRSAALWRLWLYLAWQDTRTRYARTKIGPYWTTISLAIWTVSIGVVYAVLFKVPIHEFLPYLATGLISWNFVSTILLASPSGITDSRAAFLNVQLPLPVLVMRIVVRTFISYLHSLPVVLIVVLVLAPRTYANGGWMALLELPVMILLVSTVMVPASFLIAALCTRFPDMGQVVASLVQVAFLVTPILWSTETLANARWIYELNPLYYVTVTLRLPLLGEWVPASIIGIDILLAVVGLATLLLMGDRIAKRVPKWL